MEDTSSEEQYAEEPAAAEAMENTANRALDNELPEAPALTENTEFSANGVYYRVTSVSADGTGGTAEVIKTPEDAEGLGPVLAIPDTVTDLSTGTVYNVTKIASGAFSGNTWIQEVTIAKRLEKIGRNAFSECANIEKIVFSKNNSLYSIGDNAFYGLSGNVVFIVYNEDMADLLISSGVNENAIIFETIDIADAAAEPVHPQVYTGGPVTPGISISYNGDMLYEGYDYEVEYLDNINKGIGTVVITGLGEYSGTKTVTYEIREKEVIPEVSLSEDSFIYNGETRKPSVTVSDGDNILTPDEDYTVAYPADCKNTGVHDITVTLKGNYKGTKTASFRITPKQATPEVILSADTYTFNDKTQKPSVTVKDGNDILSGDDYTTTFSPGCKNAGTYKVTVTLKGNYRGTKTVSFKILPKKVTPSVTLSHRTYTYNGKVRKPKATVRIGGRKLTSGYRVTYSHGRKNAGTYKVTVTLKGNYRGTKTVSFKILPKKVTPSVTLSHRTYTYNGKVRKPKTAVIVGGKKLASGYKVAYSPGRKNIGTYRVRVTLKGNYTGTRTVLFRIIPKRSFIAKVAADRTSVTVKWKKQAKAAGYQVQYSTAQSFKGAKTITIKGQRMDTVKFQKPVAGKKYYVRVRAYKIVHGEKYFSRWASNVEKNVSRKGKEENREQTPVKTPAKTPDTAAETTALTSAPADGQTTAEAPARSQAQDEKQPGAKPHVHTWVDIKKTVHHEAEGHYDWKQTGTRTVVDEEAWDEDICDWICECNFCGYRTLDGYEMALHGYFVHNHYDEKTGRIWSYGIYYDPVDTKHHDAVTHEEPVYDNVWVEDKAAWDETVVTGQKCSGCGATR